MGAVYRAHHLAMDRRVAVKLLKPHLTEDDQALQRFAREARSTQKVESPHAVKVLDFGVTPHHDYYMVLEYLDGRTVQRELDVDGPFAPSRVLHVAKQALRALGAAHRSGIIHRDIKPDNLLLMKVDADPDFTKVLDFGVAKLMEGAAQSSKSALAITQAGMVFGTPEFMSPEQACGQTLDPRSDLYSLAATMFAMLTGCGMYPAKSAIEWLTSHARQPPPHLVDGRPELAAHTELDAMLQRCLAKRPEQRPESADAMIAMIERLESGQPAYVHAPTAPRKPVLAGTFSPSSYIVALSAEPDPDATLVPPPTPQATAPTMSAPSTDVPVLNETGAVPAMPSRRGTWLVIGGVAVVAMVVAVIAVASSSKKKKAVEPPVAAKVTDAGTDAAVAMVSIDAGVADAAPLARDAGVPLTGSNTPRPSHTATEVAKLLASAEEAQRNNKRMVQIRKADAARALDPHNVRAILLLADGLIAYGDLDHGCKYLRELAGNAIARQRMHSAGCPAN